MFSGVDRLRAFFLAGTVPVPSPFPAVGKITAQLRAGDRSPSAQDLAMDALRVEHWQSPRVMIARTVLVEDVQAVVIPDDPHRVNLLEGTWYFRPDIERRLLPLLCANEETRGLVYVHESAPVYMQVEVGMTAAESAEYYPPVIRERNDEHYHLGNLAYERPVTLCCG